MHLITSLQYPAAPIHNDSFIHLDVFERKNSIPVV